MSVAPSRPVRPILSIIIPVYARRRELHRLLLSIARQLPTENSFEVIIVENRRRLNHRWLNEQTWPFPFSYAFSADGATARCRNIGAAMASGDLLFFLDSDIEISPRTIDKIVATCRDRMAVCSADVWPRADQPRSLATHLYDVPAYFRRSYRSKSRKGLAFQDFVSCAFAMRSEEFWRIGGFDEGFLNYGYEDVEFAFRAERNGKKFQMASVRVMHHKALNGSLLMSREVELGRSAVHFTRVHEDIEDYLPLGVRDTLSGSLVFPEKFDIKPLLAEAQAIEKSLAALRARPNLRRASELFIRGRDIYRQITLYGRYCGIRAEIS
ncbi:glycosyltransferase family 2 protein [Nocardiopsis dassonvillei]|uniref:glycosyltransferase family 2 protein n=1 Tax=Nocardiopsis dassonvillei TaxID=2014 RepID=UPI0033FA2A92